MATSGTDVFSITADRFAIALAQEEPVLLRLPQVECPVVHRFGPGIYIREVSMAAGTFAIGHYQTQEHLNVMLTGRVTMVNEHGESRELVAPMMFVAPPGRKIGFVHEDMVWLNIYATDETDIDKLEATYLRKNENWQSHAAEMFALEQAAHEVDRADYLAMLLQNGLTEATVRAQSENESDQIPMAVGYTRIRILPSPIEGNGCFISFPAKAGEILGPARIGGKRTPLGRFTNHSPTPNCVMAQVENGDIYLVAKHDIGGCHGGDSGQEVTVDYRQVMQELAGERSCQE